MMYRAKIRMPRASRRQADAIQPGAEEALIPLVHSQGVITKAQGAITTHLHSPPSDR